MADETDHISLANRNHDFLLRLLADGAFPDWVATVAFYKAVHVVEAVFASDRGAHSTSHADREDRLKTPKYKAIFKDYTHLFTASRVARYLECRGEGKFHHFSDFMDGEAVKRLVRKRLYGVEQHSLQFLTDNGRALQKIEPSKI
jgi:hypothetical protein